MLLNLIKLHLIKFWKCIPFFPPLCSLYSKLLTTDLHPHAVFALSWARHHFRYLVWPFQHECAISSQWDHHQVKLLSSHLCSSLNRNCYVHLLSKVLNAELSSKLACLPKEPVIWYHLLQRGMEAQWAKCLECLWLQINSFFHRNMLNCWIRRDLSIWH